MSNIIDYTKYNITSTSQFNSAISQLKHEGHVAELSKLFRIIDEIIEDVDMYEAEYSRLLKNSEKMFHIHLDGRRTGDIILLYKSDGHDIDLDLRLYNVTDHKNLSRVSAPKFTRKQNLSQFDVIANKYSEVQIDYAEQCYLDIISDSQFYRARGEQRKQYSDNYIEQYYDSHKCEDPLSFEEFLQIIHYIEHNYQKHIFGSLDFSVPQHTSPITEREEQYIIRIIEDYDVIIDDAYVEIEVDDYGDKYETMYVKLHIDDYRTSKLLKSEFYQLHDLFDIDFDSSLNGLGQYGEDFEFYHPFE